jgi:Plasmid replication region DNA-binding N-term
LVINQSSTARLDGQTPAAIRPAMRKGNSVTLGGMNCRISEVRLRGVCRELLRAGRPVSHRALRQILRERFGAAGKTARVLKIWREESARVAAAKQTNDPPRQLPALPVDIQQIQERLKQAEAHAAEQRVRAEVAELREQSHQDRWALEIDRLREQLRAQPNYAREVRGLQSTVTRLTAELAALRGALAGTSVGEEGSTPGAV